MTFSASQGHATPMRANKSHAIKTRSSNSAIAELFLYRTHSAAVGHVRHAALSSATLILIVDADNDEALACGSIVEETRLRNSRRCSHRVFSQDLKSAAIARVLDEGYNIREVAAEFEVSHASLRRWVTQVIATMSPPFSMATPTLEMDRTKPAMDSRVPPRISPVLICEVSTCGASSSRVRN